MSSRRVVLFLQPEAMKALRILTSASVPPWVIQSSTTGGHSRWPEVEFGRHLPLV